MNPHKFAKLATLKQRKFMLSGRTNFPLALAKGQLMGTTIRRRVQGSAFRAFHAHGEGGPPQAVDEVHGLIAAAYRYRGGFSGAPLFAPHISKRGFLV